MLMTEDEACHRWCPMARAPVVQPYLGGDNPVTPVANRSQQHLSCLGPQCAVWRWSPAGRVEGEPRQGYCGLAPHFP